jgi:hypothetical protein
LADPEGKKSEEFKAATKFDIGKIIYPALAASFTAVVFWLFGLLSNVTNVLVPSAAVIAFDSTNCPAGWESFKEGSGRFVLGAGTGSGLTERRLRQDGGEESHALTVEEMPPHAHAYIDNQYVISSPLNRDRGGGGTADVKKQTESTGGGKGHNNMPPYIVLQWCRKT